MTPTYAKHALSVCQKSNVKRMNRVAKVNVN